MAEITKEVVIVGAGPAGLAAALYAARDRHETVVLDKFVPGGQINLTDRIENYPGIKQISGPDMVAAFMDQAVSFGAEIKNNSEVIDLKKLDDGKIMVRTDDDTYIAGVVILTPGSDYRKLGVPGEEKFRQAGTGVSYCGTCDAPFFRDKHVVAVGGGNVAVEDALHLAKYCKKVTLVHRRQEFRATKVLVEELTEEVEKGVIELRLDSVVTSINGSERVESATLKNVKTDATEELACDGVFIFVGMLPNTGFLKGVVDLDENGFIKCDPKYLRTTMPGVFVAGDCRVGAAMQLATAVGDGVAAALFMKEHLRDSGWWSIDREPSSIAFA
ncbi:MAG: FAD-dependent oxidoreductase [Sedimentisphaerales bacterium]|nr:FAD-dependent oxidoreductase [Sedimentisphaerales bacterium]